MDAPEGRPPGQMVQMLRINQSCVKREGVIGDGQGQSLNLRRKLERRKKSEELLNAETS